MDIGSIHSLTMVFNKSQVSGFKLCPVLDGDGACIRTGCAESSK